MAKIKMEMELPESQYSCNKCRFRFLHRETIWYNLIDVYFWRCQKCDRVFWREAYKFWGRPL